MSYANGTPNYNLPQTVGSDKRDWSDTNPAFLILDAAVKSASDNATQADGKADNAQTTADSAVASAASAVTTANAANATAQTAAETAQLAQNAATAAQQTATQAASDAQSAQTTANSAQQTASNADTVALQAQTAVNGVINRLTDNNENFNFGYNTSTGEYGYYDSSDVFHPFKSGLEETTLWTNSSPTSSFANVTVSLSDNMSNYEYIRVYYRYSTTDNTEVSVLMSVSDFQISNASGKPNMALGARTTSPTKRGVHYASDSSIAFASAVNDGGNVANTIAIPTKITGVK